MKSENFKTLILLFLSIVLITACMPGSGHSSTENPAGFFTGVWHGWIAPVSLILGLFNSDIRVYEQFNTGWWYDFGFYIAIISGFGGIAFSRKKRNGNN
jgi:hypothetical protein